MTGRWCASVLAASSIGRPRGAQRAAGPAPRTVRSHPGGGSRGGPLGGRTGRPGVGADEAREPISALRPGPGRRLLRQDPLEAQDSARSRLYITPLCQAPKGPSRGVRGPESGNAAFPDRRTCKRRDRREVRGGAHWRAACPAGLDRSRRADDAAMPGTGGIFVEASSLAASEKPRAGTRCGWRRRAGGSRSPGGWAGGTSGKDCRAQGGGHGEAGDDGPETWRL